MKFKSISSLFHLKSKCEEGILYLKYTDLTILILKKVLMVLVLMFTNTFPLKIICHVPLIYPTVDELSTLPP